MNLTKMLLKKFILFCVMCCVTVADNDADCPTIVKRSQWTSVKPKGINYLIVPIPYVLIHHSVTPECGTRAKCTERVENIRSYHMDTLGWNDIGCSFFVGGDGRIYEGCGWTKEGAHTFGYNKRSICIMFIGNFQDKPANDTMVNAAHKLITCGVSQGVLRSDVKVIAARQVSSTLSPGFELFTQIQDWSEWESNP